MSIFKKIFGVFLVLVVVASSMVPVSPVLAEEPEADAQPKLLNTIEIFKNRLAAGANLKAAKADAAAKTEPAIFNMGAEALAAPNALYGTDGKMLTDYFGVANWANSPALTKFIDELPGLGPANDNLLGQYIPVAVRDTLTYPGSDYYEIAVVEYEEKLHSELDPTRLRGYVQIVPAGWTGMDYLGNAYAAVPLTVANGLTQDITIRGVQAYGASKPHFLGPAIIAIGAPKAGDPGTPVRIKFYNLLPTGVDGELFIPMDDTVMGAGMGPAMDVNNNPVAYTENRAAVHLHGSNTVWISDGTPHQWVTPASENTPYPEGVSVADVPDMWFDANGLTVPAGTPGATNNPGDGAMTIFYSNAQSARLMWYHDHALGITRLNVYAGEAAGYIVTDQVEQDLINGTNNSGINPDGLSVLPGIGIPLIIQDRTFVDPATVGLTDPTWLDPLQTSFGTTPGTAHAGDLWYPHVYMPAQNPWDITGTNPFGRWMYGPWFYPPTTIIDHGPVANEYYDPVKAPWEPPMRPATPNPSMPGEAFMDTMLVNGTVYPYLNVDPKAYRFRILNAANDRFINLQLYQANTGIVGSITTTPGSGYTADPVVTVTNAPGDLTGYGFSVYATADLNPGATRGQITFSIRTVGSNYTAPPIITVSRARRDITGVGATVTAVLYTAPTEVGMIPVTGTNWLPPFDASGVPDPEMAGPDWIQIGTEGGFLPAPTVIPAQPITWNTNPTTFNFGTVKGHSLLLGSAERADVIVDFSAFQGKTIILYNDSPAAFPAGSPTYDYYTNNQDLTGVGGAPTTQPGKAPNTRTIMQIRVSNIAPTPYNLTALETVWAKGIGSTKRGVFELTQDPIIVPQEEYNSAYGKTGVGTDTLPTAAVEKYIQVNTYTKTISPIDANGTVQAPVTLPVELKGAHDEMGGVYDTGFGRMSGMLGLEMPATNSRIGQFLPYGYASPPVDVMAGSLAGSLIGTLDDGTQIWNIIHNGVDTHTIHVHLFNAQLINRVGWDGIMLPPDANELGWKETFRMNPLEQIIIALRPILPTSAQIPFIDKVPNSVRLIDPTLPPGATLNAPPPAGWFDPNGVAIPSISNHYVNFGWEYVYHCHILAHEEMDMMHGMAYAVPPRPPTALSAIGVNNRAVLTWQSPASASLTGFMVQRATDMGFTTGLVTWNLGNVTTYTDTTYQRTQNYYYRVLATNTVGDNTLAGFPTITVKSSPSNVFYLMGTPPLAPTLVSPANASVITTLTPTLTWNPSFNATSYTVYVSTDNNFPLLSLAVNQTTTTTSYTIPVGALALNTTYYWRVQANSGAGSSPWSTVWSFTPTIPVPLAPTGLFGVANSASQITLSWQGGNNNQIQIWRRTFDTAYVLVGTTLAGATSYVNTGLTAATTYYYYVVAVNASGVSPRSNTAAVTTLAGAVVTVPTAPTLTAPLNGVLVPNTRPTMQWAAAAGATSYTVQISTTAAFTTLAVNTRGITTNSYQVPLGRLTIGRTYYWRVSSTNSAGTSTWSVVGSFRT